MLALTFQTALRNGSVYPKERLRAKSVSYVLADICPQRKKERRNVEEGWIFLKIVSMSPIPFSLQ